MTLTFPRAPLGAIALAATMALSVGSARAQGTDAQREACTPDAFRLCQATIPDIDKTTACMKAHYAQLSPRCKVAFNAVTGPAAPRAPRREAVAPPPPADAGAQTDADDGMFATPGIKSYADQIRGYCRQGLIDPFTCRNTLAVLRDTQ